MKTGKVLTRNRLPTIPLSGGRGVALVDEGDLEQVQPYSWCLSDNGSGKVYAKGRVSGKVVFLHRFITNAPKGVDVDHWNDDGLDNRRANLRVASRSQNLANSTGRRHRRSQFRGLYWHRKLGKWGVAIKSDGQRQHLGVFESEEEAARAWDAAALAAWGAFARLNFPG